MDEYFNPQSLDIEYLCKYCQSKLFYSINTIGNNLPRYIVLRLERKTKCYPAINENKNSYNKNFYINGHQFSNTNYNSNNTYYNNHNDNYSYSEDKVSIEKEIKIMDTLYETVAIILESTIHATA